MWAESVFLLGLKAGWEGFMFRKDSTYSSGRR